MSLLLKLLFLNSRVCKPLAKEFGKTGRDFRTQEVPFDIVKVKMEKAADTVHAGSASAGEGMGNNSLEYDTRSEASTSESSDTSSSRGG